MASKLFLNANMICKADHVDTKRCAVEKVIEVSDREFKKLLEKPSERNYNLAPYREIMGFYNDMYHCVLMIDSKNGDGLLIDSEGAEYARYSQFIPNAKALIQANEQTEAMRGFDEHLKSWVRGCASDGAGQPEFEASFDKFMNAPDTRQALRRCLGAALSLRPEVSLVKELGNKIIAENKDITEIKLYCPLTFRIEPEDSYDDLDEVDSANYIGYEREINARIRVDLESDEDAVERGLAAYFHDENLDQKVLSAVPRVETRNGDIYGVITVKSYGELSKVEMIDLIDDLTGQLSDGFGEGFEQREIRLGDESVYISFWDCDDDYFLKPESEVFPEQGLNQGMGGLN